MNSGESSARRDFFISYASVDRRWAEWMARLLVEAGYTIELDVWEWAVGADFVDAMRAALDRADRVLSIYTDAYFANQHARAEFSAAFASGPGKVLQIKVEQCNVPELYRPLIYIDLTGLGEVRAAQKLISGITSKGSNSRASFLAEGVGGSSSPFLGDKRKIEFPRLIPKVWNVPPRNPFFSGRRNLLYELECRLNDESEIGQRRVAIVPLQGMGGIGKTQVAIEYAHRHAAEYRAVWWINAEKAALAAVDLAFLAANLGLQTNCPQKQAIDRLWSELCRRSDWLLIYDNISDVSEFSKLRPPESGHVILTSRNPDIGRAAELVRVPKFERHESIGLLRRRCVRLSELQADQISSAVGDLPLAVEQAGCFLHECGLQVDDYIELLEGEPAEAGLADITIDRHPGLVSVVNTSCQLLQEMDAAAARLLEKLAFYAPEILPFVPAGSPLDRFGVRVGNTRTTASAVRHITSLGLARNSGASLQMHRLVQALVRARIPQDRRYRVVHEAEALIATAHPGQEPENPLSWPEFAILVPHVQALTEGKTQIPDGQPIEFRNLVIATSRYLTASGQFEFAKAFANRTHGRWADVLGRSHPDTLAIAHVLGKCRRMTGDLAGSRTLLEETLEFRRRFLGYSSRDTLATASSLAIVLRASGNSREARTLNEDVLARRRELFGVDDEHTLASADNFAVDLRVSGDYLAAQILDEDTLCRLKRKLGPDHPSTLESATGLAEDLLCLGDAQRSHALSQDTLNRRRQILGNDHPDTLSSANSLAEALRLLGDLPAAYNLHKATFYQRRVILGDTHPDTLISALGLAEDMKLLGYLADARLLYEGTIATFRETLGENHRDAMRAVYGLAEVLRLDGDVVGALRLHQRVYDLRLEFLDDGHPDTRKSARQIAAIRSNGPDGA